MSPTGVSFGIHLPVRILPGAGPNPPSAALLVDTVDAAKKSGFSSVWVTDHIVYMDPWLDCMMMLAAIAGQANNLGMTIATGVLGLPLRHPASTESDFLALGIPFQERRKMLEDGVPALRALLSGENVSHHGPYYDFDNVTVAPRGLQQPCVPIWLSSWGSPAGMRRVARLGDGWVSSGWHSTPEEFNEALNNLDTALKNRGKDPGSFPNAVNTIFMYIDEDGDQARSVAVPIIEQTIRAKFETEGGHFLVGSYQECQDLLRRWMAAFLLPGL